jgi:hypothetical protein
MSFQILALIFLRELILQLLVALSIKGFLLLLIKMDTFVLEEIQMVTP